MSACVLIVIHFISLLMVIVIGRLLIFPIFWFCITVAVIIVIFIAATADVTDDAEVVVVDSCMEDTS